MDRYPVLVACGRIGRATCGCVAVFTGKGAFRIDLPGCHGSSSSLAPHNSETAFWALLSPTGMFLVVYSLPRNHAMRLISLMLGMAVFPVVLFLMQYGGGMGAALHISNEYGMLATAS